MNVMIAGGSGLIGTALSDALIKDGHQVWILTRSSKLREFVSKGIVALEWDGVHLGEWIGTFSQMDAVINLAGETISTWPWTQSRKQQIHSSRVDAGVVLTSAFEKASRRPSILIQASGIGYYGASKDEVVTEDMPPGSDFMAQVAIDWEASSRFVDALGVRRVIIRQAIVLSPKGGILSLMALPVRLFVGGRLGSGHQGLPWIHIDDVVGAIRFLLTNGTARGVFNLCAPNTPSNADFMRVLCSRLRRPYWLPVPKFALRLILGEMSDLLLNGQFAIPQRLVSAGYVFKHQALSEALDDLFSKPQSVRAQQSR